MGCYYDVERIVGELWQVFTVGNNDVIEHDVRVRLFQFGNSFDKSRVDVHTGDVCAIWIELEVIA